MKFTFKLFNKRINIKLPKVKLSRKYRSMLERHRQNIPAAILMFIMLVGLIGKQPVQARHGAAKGAFFGGATGAALGGALGGGRGAGIGAATGLAAGALIGAASDDKSYSDPAESRLNKLYKKKDSIERKLNRTSSPDKQRRYQKQLDDINADINDLENRLYGRGRRRY